MIAAPKPKVARKIETIEALNVRLRNRWSGMIGSAARASTITNTARKTTPAAMLPHTAGSLHWEVSATVRPTRIGMSPSVRVITPRSVSYTHLRAHETRHDLVCRLLLEKK